MITDLQEACQNVKAREEEDESGVGLLHKRGTGANWMQPLPRLGPMSQVPDVEHDLTPPELPSRRVQWNAPEDQSEGVIK